ncbi:MAG: hypothetical protein M3270_10435 [Thermoproteota archaeon]|nr:hypothetical protein [Thermoproteota archaeon]
MTAIPFAFFLWKGYSWSKYAVVVWSVLGIADLVNAITLGLITNSDFGSPMVTTFPWILVPTVGVPLALAPSWGFVVRTKEMGINSNTQETS